MLNYLRNVADNLNFRGKLWLGLAIFLLSSCASVRSGAYFQNKDGVGMNYFATLSSSSPVPLRIQPDDMLVIVISSMSEETNALFNTLNTGSATPSRSAEGAGSSQPLGYLTDVSGEVNLPLLGKVRVAGLSLDEASTYLSNQLERYVKAPTVNVRVLNQKFTVIGEVTRPGIYNLSGNPTTLPEVIAMAGDLTLYGRQDNVRLIRTVNNKREIIDLDLTSQQVFDSPYYFIENNDVVYVGARPGKTFSTERLAQLLPIGLGISSTIILLASLLIR